MMMWETLLRNVCYVNTIYIHSCGLQIPWQKLPQVKTFLERINTVMPDIGTRAHWYCYLITIVGLYSWFTTFYKLRGKQTEVVSSRFTEFKHDFEFPQILLSGQWKEFTSHQFKNLWATWYIQLGISLHYPQGNGISKRMHKKMKVIPLNGRTT